jgi:hypothetical protein
MCFFGGGGSGGGSQVDYYNRQAQEASQRALDQQRADEAARQGRITQGIGAINRQFSQFNNDYFANKANEYRNFYQPQVDRQYTDTRQNSLYQLARQGMTDSTAAGKVFGDLAKDKANQDISVGSNANSYVQQARSQIEGQRNSLVNQLTATADPSLAASAAVNAAGALQKIQPAGGYSPLAGLFNTFTGAAGNALQNYMYGNTSGGLLGQLYKPSSSSSSQRVIS